MNTVRDWIINYAQTKTCRFGGTSLWVALMVLGVGCLPVPSVIGRPAAVLPDGQEVCWEGWGGWTVHKEYVGDDYDTPEIEREVQESDSGFVYRMGGKTMGFGRRMELNGGFNNIQVHGEARYQLLGAPVGADREGFVNRFPIDLSIEVGTGITPIPLFNMFIHDIHIGASISKTFKRCTPYLAYRHHWGTYHSFAAADYHFLETSSSSNSACSTRALSSNERTGKAWWWKSFTANLRVRTCRAARGTCLPGA